MMPSLGEVLRGAGETLRRLAISAGGKYGAATLQREEDNALAKTRQQMQMHQLRLRAIDEHPELLMLPENSKLADQVYGKGAGDMMLSGAVRKAQFENAFRAGVQALRRPGFGDAERMAPSAPTGVVANAQAASGRTLPPGVRTAAEPEPGTSLTLRSGNMSMTRSGVSLEKADEAVFYRLVQAYAEQARTLGHVDAEGNPTPKAMQYAYGAAAEDFTTEGRLVPERARSIAEASTDRALKAALTREQELAQRRVRKEVPIGQEEELAGLPVESRQAEREARARGESAARREGTESVPSRLSPEERRRLGQALSINKNLGKLGTLFNEVGKFSVGPGASQITTIGEYIGTNPEKVSRFRAANNTLQNVLVYLRSGQQTNISEIERLEKELPNMNVAPSAWAARFRHIMELLHGELSAQQAVFHEQNLRESKVLADTIAEIEKNFPDLVGAPADPTKPTTGDAELDKALGF